MGKAKGRSAVLSPGKRLVDPSLSVQLRNEASTAALPIPLPNRLIYAGLGGKMSNPHPLVLSLRQHQTYCAEHVGPGRFRASGKITPTCSIAQRDRVVIEVPLQAIQYTV